MRPLPNTRPALEQSLISAVGQLARRSLPVIIYTFKQYHQSTRKQQKIVGILDCISAFMSIFDLLMREIC